MKAWLKGGFLGAVFVIIAYSLLFIIGNDSIFSSYLENFVFIIAYPIMPLTRNLLLSGNLSLGNWILVFLLFIAAYYFIIGALIGFIIGKIKEKKK